MGPAPPPDKRSAIAKLGALCAAVVALVGMAVIARSKLGLSEEAFTIILIVGLAVGALGVAVTAVDFFSSSARVRALAIFLAAIALVGVAGWIGGSTAASPGKAAAAAPARRLNALFARLEEKRKKAYEDLGTAKGPARQARLAAELRKLFASAATEVRHVALGTVERRRLTTALIAVSGSYERLGQALTDPEGGQGRVEAAGDRVARAGEKLRRAERSLRRAGYSIEEARLK
jgi:outer membrane murein-binding lipoprotein Lpp